MRSVSRGAPRGALDTNFVFCTVVCRDVDYREVRKELASINWIFFRAGSLLILAIARISLACLVQMVTTSMRP